MMICDRCGKQNKQNSPECPYCAAPMPALVSCGGFADILSYERPVESASVYGGEYNTMEGYSEEEMNRLIERVDELIKTNRRNMYINLIVLAISFLVLICTIAFGFIAINGIADNKEIFSQNMEEVQVVKQDALESFVPENVNDDKKENENLPEMKEQTSAADSKPLTNLKYVICYKNEAGPDAVKENKAVKVEVEGKEIFVSMKDNKLIFVEDERRVGREYYDNEKQKIESVSILGGKVFIEELKNESGISKIAYISGSGDKKEYPTDNVFYIDDDDNEPRG